MAGDEQGEIDKELMKNWRAKFVSSEKKELTERTVLTCQDLVLVPYYTKMIPRYQGWFFEKELRDLTSTEIMTDEQAQVSHRRWTTETDKVMFVVLNRHSYDKTGKEIPAMIGDVNMVVGTHPTAIVPTAELLLMIAEDRFRGRGLGRQMLLTLMRFAVEEYQIVFFEARILRRNSASMKLFINAGFKISSLCEKFDEFTMDLAMDEQKRNKLIKETDALGYTVTVQDVREQVYF